MKLTTNPLAPHRAIIWLEAEVQELLPTGECSGRPASKIERFAVMLDGRDQALTVRRLNDLLAEVKAKCKTTD